MTTQFVSVPARSVDDPDRLNTAQIQVIEAKRHRNKLRTGHLSGNRFDVLLRDVTGADAAALKRTVDATAAEIARLGFLNYYGEQRFGRDGDTDRNGFRLLRGEPVRRLGRNALRFTLSAAQSRLFNDWLADRLRDGLTHRAVRGDVMQVVASGGCFVVDDPEAEQQRFEARQTVLTGPVFGPGMRMPDGEPAEREAAVLDRFELTPEAFSRYRRLTAGTRRAAVVWPRDFQAGVVGSAVRLSFVLPAGAYATVLLREFSKADLAS